MSSKDITNRYSETVTIASGAGSINTPNTYAEIMQVVIKPTTGSTTYDFSVKNPASIEVFGSASTRTGTWVQWISLPARGIYSLSVSSASVDEDFDFEVLWR